MAHPEQMLFVETVAKHIAPEGFSQTAILEIGSYDVNGSVRTLFPDSRYLGVDLTPGPGVDQVCEGRKVSAPDNTYDVTISAECFEHDPTWRETFANMYRLTKPGGVVIFTCASRGRIEHGTSRRHQTDSPGTQSVGWDYYKNLTEKDFRKNFDIKNQFSDHFFLYNSPSKDLYFAGRKVGDQANFLMRKTELAAECKTGLRTLNQEIADKLKEKRKNYNEFFSPLEYYAVLKPLMNLSEPLYQRYALKRAKKL